MTAFRTGLVTFLLAGVLLVGLQAAGVIAGDADLTTGTLPGLRQLLTTSASVTGLLGSLLAYMFRRGDAEAD